MHRFYWYWPLRKENGSFKTLGTTEAESQLEGVMEVLLLDHLQGSLDR